MPSDWPHGLVTGTKLMGKHSRTGHLALSGLLSLPQPTSDTSPSFKEATFPLCQGLVWPVWWAEVVWNRVLCSATIKRIHFPESSPVSSLSRWQREKTGKRHLVLTTRVNLDLKYPSTYALEGFFYSPPIKNKNNTLTYQIALTLLFHCNDLLQWYLPIKVIHKL